MDIEIEFQRLINAFEVAGIDYAVVGGFAVAIWGAPRATMDIDFLVLPTDVSIILSTVRPLGFTFEALPITFQDGMKLRRVTKIAGNEALTLDLILVDAHLEPVWRTRSPVATEVGVVKVISREGLIQMKTEANRPQDIGDIIRLIEQDR